MNFKYNYSSYSGLNEKLEEYFSKLKEFPEYSDILEIIEKSAKELKICLNEDECRLTATEVFKKAGSLLKQKRIE